MRTRAYVHKRGKTWCVITPLPDGRKSWKTVGRKKDAEAVRDDINRRTKLGGAYVEPPRAFGGFADDWLDAYEQRVRPNTHELAKGARRHLQPLDQLHLDTIRAHDVDVIVTALARKRPRMAQLALRYAKSILRTARERGHVVDEAILSLEPPRYEERAIRALTWDEVDKIASRLPESIRRIAPVAAATGLRQGELFALRDSDLDLEAATVRVRESKTRAGVRRVDLPDVAVRLLREQLMARPAGTELIFPAPEGNGFDRHTFMSRYWREAAKRAGLEGTNFHTLRHTYISLMASAGVHVSVIAELVGHSDGGALLLRRYRTLFPGETRRAVNALNEVITPPPTRDGVAEG